MSCPHQNACALTQSISMKEALRVWQSFYCEGCFTRCERYKLAVAGVAVPPRLLPNGRLTDGQDEVAAAYAQGGRAA
jgi:hypothetical protein